MSAESSADAIGTARPHSGISGLKAAGLGDRAEAGRNEAHRPSERHETNSRSALLRDRSAAGLPPCCPTHKPDNERMPYVMLSEDAQRRVAAGQQQRRCPLCKLWYWRHEFGPGWSAATRADPDVQRAVTEAAQRPALGLSKSLADGGRSDGLRRYEETLQ